MEFSERLKVWHRCQLENNQHIGRLVKIETHTVGELERAVPWCKAAWGSSQVLHPRPSPPNPPNTHISPFSLRLLSFSPALPMPCSPAPCSSHPQALASCRLWSLADCCCCLPPACYHRTSHMCRCRDDGGPRARGPMPLPVRGRPASLRWHFGDSVTLRWHRRQVATVLPATNSRHHRMPPATLGEDTLRIRLFWLSGHSPTHIVANTDIPLFSFPWTGTSIQERSDQQFKK